MYSSEQKKELIKDINNIVFTHVVYHDLYHGGCCFSAGVIAQHLEEKKIPYKVICYKPSYNKDKKLQSIAEKSECCHVTIEIDGEQIGDEYFTDDGYGLDEIQLDMSSQELFDVYENNAWNSHYDTSNNKVFKSDIDKVFSLF